MNCFWWIVISYLLFTTSTCLTAAMASQWPVVHYCSLAELRQRQELIMRNQMAMAPQILAQGQQRLQGVPAQFEPRFMERFVPELTQKKTPKQNSRPLVKSNPENGQLQVHTGRMKLYHFPCSGWNNQQSLTKHKLLKLQWSSLLCHVKMIDFPCLCVIRELVPPTEMVPSDARQMHMGPHLGPPLPPHANVLPGRAFPGAGEQGPILHAWEDSQRVYKRMSMSINGFSFGFSPSAGYGFLPSEPMETVARRQELIHKQNIAR